MRKAKINRLVLNILLPLLVCFAPATFVFVFSWLVYPICSSNPSLLVPGILLAALGAYYLGSLNPRDVPPTSTLPLSSTQALNHDTSASNLQAAWSDLVTIVGKDHISTSHSDLSTHGTSDWSSYSLKEGEQYFLVVYPSSTEEVSKIMKTCHARRIPVTPYSGGTSLEGHYAPTRGGVCIDFARMDRILQVHEQDLDVVVQPAVGWQALNEELEEYNLFFPPDPGFGAEIGGMVATGCSGTNSYRYGTMREWVLSLKVVLADGTVVQTRQRPRKSSAGYDLTRLFIGSEGTLGLVTEATLKLTVKPSHENVAVVSFPTIQHAAECVSNIVKEGVPLAMVEIMDDLQLRYINESQTTSRQWKEVPTLFLRFAGTKDAVKQEISIAERLAKKHSSKSFEFAKDKHDMAELWSARKEALWSVLSMKTSPDEHIWTTDVAVPISQMPRIIDETKADFTKHDIRSGVFGHVGDGNFHTIILFHEAKREVVEGVVHRMVKRAVELEGTVTGEHGVGLVKRDYLQHELGESSVDLMRKIKLSLDPLALLNPDKVVRLTEPEKGEVKEW